MHYRFPTRAFKAYVQPDRFDASIIGGLDAQCTIHYAL